MTALATQDSHKKEVSRPLRVLVPLIREDLKKGEDAAQSAGMPYYRAAGAKMLEAKKSPEMKHGQFENWIKRNFDISIQHARRYMALSATEKEHTRSFSSMGEFMRETGRDPGYGKVVRKQDWHEPIKEVIDRAKRDAERIQQEDLTRKQEREAEYQLALRLIDIGYKVLAKELHPDKGGSRDAMQRLSRVRDRLKASA